MNMEFVNRICPNCKNPNYMVSLVNFSKAYKYKCMNCNGYFNDIDFEKEPLHPVWKSKRTNTKVDMVKVVRCKDCESWWQDTNEENCSSGFCRNQFGVCGGQTTDMNWFCADGKRR